MAIHQEVHHRTTAQPTTGDRDPGLAGSQVLDPRGQKIGRITDVVFEGSHAWPTWLVVKTGWFRAEHFVPVRGSYRTESSRVVVPFDRRHVRSSPTAGSDHVISARTRALLAQHYHLSDLQE